VLMLIPLGIGLLVKARYPDTAADLQPTFAQAANVGLMGLMATMLLLNWRTLLSTIGSGAILAALIFIVLSFVIGYFLAPAATRSTLGLGTAQRNIAAAMVVVGDNFSDPNVLIMVLVGAVLMMVMLLPAAGELGKRQEGTAVPVAATAE